MEDPKVNKEQVSNHSLSEKQKLTNIIWENIDRLLKEQKRDYKWLAEKTGVNPTLYYGSKYRNTDFSVDRIVQISEALGVSVASLCVVPEKQFSSEKFLVASGSVDVDEQDYLSVFINYLPQLSLDRQRAIYEIMLSFFNTSTQELRSHK